MFSKVIPFIKKNSSVLEIGSYYGVLGNLIKKMKKLNLTQALSCPSMAQNIQKKILI